MHLSDGTLRRWVDEPLSVDAHRRGHLDACDRCRERVGRVRADRDTAAMLMEPAAPGGGDTAAAWERFAATVAGATASAPPQAQLPRRVVPRRPRPPLRWSAGVAVAAALSAVLVVTGAAQGVIDIFQPKQFAAVAVTPADVRALSGLGSFGTVGGSLRPTLTQVSSAGDAATAAGVDVELPGHLPAGTAGAPTYWVLSGGTVTFTFSAAIAEASAASRGVQLPAMPAGLDGSTLAVTLPSVAAVSYGADLAGLLSGDPGAIGPQTQVVLASRVPTVTSTGATVSEIEQYLLAQPGIPADLAAEIRAIGDPSSTLPVPVPVNRATGQSVSVAGASGLAIGDSTGLGSLVVWQRDGVVHAVGGTQSVDAEVAVASSLR